MRLILARHGNTFDPGSRVTWVGQANDLPLVAEGWAQADRLAAALQRCGVRPTAIWTGPLRRARDTAARVAERLGLNPPEVDARLDELDYGPWSGLTDKEVAERFGRDALEGWNRHCRWPVGGGWGGSAEHARAEAASFAEGLARQAGRSDVGLAVTSNGRLRYFLALVEADFGQRVQSGRFKVRTGHVCALELGAHPPRLLYWNVDPAGADIL